MGTAFNRQGGEAGCSTGLGGKVPVYLARGIAICSAVPTIIESAKHIVIL